MQATKLVYSYLLYFFICTNLLQTEGFISGTLIKTPFGYTQIDQLNIGDKVISTNHNLVAEECLITYITHHTIDCCMKIGINNKYVYTAPNQKFYSYNQKKWVSAHQLQPSDLLMNWHGKCVVIDTLEIVNDKYTMYQLSVDINHTFCISPHNLIAHNSHFVVLNLFPYVTPIITEIIQTGLAISTTFIGAFFAQKISKKHRHNNIRNETVNNSSAHSDFGGNGGSEDPEDDNKNDNEKQKHPHGIYKESPAHRSKQCGRKSPSPKNGQHCLDHSLPGKGNSTQRISIEGNNFIVLKQTSYREFHGYCVAWDELHLSLQQVLRDHQLVTKAGKIIKEAAQRIFK